MLQMEPWYPFVIGTVAFLYVHSFNRIQKKKILTWNELFTEVIPTRSLQGSNL